MCHFVIRFQWTTTEHTMTLWWNTHLLCCFLPVDLIQSESSLWSTPLCVERSDWLDCVMLHLWVYSASGETAESHTHMHTRAHTHTQLLRHFVFVVGTNRLSLKTQNKIHLKSWAGRFNVGMTSLHVYRLRRWSSSACVFMIKVVLMPLFLSWSWFNTWTLCISWHRASNWNQGWNQLTFFWLCTETYVDRNVKLFTCSTSALLIKTNGPFHNLPQKSEFRAGWHQTKLIPLQEPLLAILVVGTVTTK